MSDLIQNKAISLKISDLDISTRVRNVLEKCLIDDLMQLTREYECMDGSISTPLVELRNLLHHFNLHIGPTGYAEIISAIIKKIGSPE